ncbi:MAG: phosphotransferase family protein [Pseudomonadota bacterium]
MSEFEGRLGEVLAQVIPRYVALNRAERLSGGASQETYRIDINTADGDRLLAMRRAPGGEHVEPTPGHPGLAAEALLMRSARAAGVPEPEVFHVLTPADGLGDGFIMEWLEGVALGARVVRSPELDEIRPHLAQLCGEALGRIHSIDLVATGLDKHLEVITPEQYIEQTWQRYRDFETAQPMIDYAGRWLLENLPAQSELALVHNDFRNGNVMFDADGIVAVLDWEVAHIGDPMRDLGWICTNSWRFGRSDLPVGGFGHYEDLFAGYEAVTGRAVDPQRVKFWEVFGSFWWAIGCLGMAEHYRNGPDKTVERPAIGRRSSECQVDCVNLLIPGHVELVSTTDNALQDMPRLDELVVSVRNFLHNDVMDETTGRLNFLARVAGNSLDIVLRDLSHGATARAQEWERLRALFDADADLQSLRWKLVHGLRDGSIELDKPGLVEHLRATVVNEVAIDQPKYSGFQTALDSGR